MIRCTTEQFIQKAISIHGNKYDYSQVNYQKSSVKTTIICRKHGGWQQRPNDHLTGYGCPACKFDLISSQKRATKELFIMKARQVHDDAYDYSNVQYVNAITSVEIICPTHGSFFQTPDKHTSGKTCCPQCSLFTSRGEREIEKILQERNIPYEREKRFPGLCGATINSRLRYDFFIPSQNLLIEFDGEQHFSPVQTKGRLTKEQAIDKHKRTKINDRKKNEFAIKNGYKLIRIKYDENINVALAKISSVQQHQ